MINDGLEEIGEYAYNGCWSLKKVVILNAVKTIKDGAFRDCRRLTTLALGDGLEKIGEGEFFRCI